MASFFPTFKICPLIDQNRVVGICEDKSDDSVVVSLGKNIVIRFILTEQKQISSWTTKIKLSCPVIYDYGKNRYVGVFNDNLISSWTDCDDLKKLSMSKLPENVYAIHSRPNTRPVIVFNSGLVAVLEEDDQHSIREINSHICPLKENIKKSDLYIFDKRFYVCILLESDKLYFLPLNQQQEPFAVNLTIPDVDSKLSSFTVLEGKGILVSLWDDCRVFMTDLSHIVSNDSFCGNFVTEFMNINAGLPTAMICLSNNHIAIYAADINGEGSILLLLDVMFGVLLHSIRLKLYNNPPSLWKCSTKYILAPVGQYLTVIPFQLKPTKLNTLIASKSNSNLPLEEVIWEENTSISVDSKERLSSVNEINEDVAGLTLSENLVSQYLREGKLQEVVDILHNTNDASDECIVNTLLACLSCQCDNKNDLIYKILTLPLVNDNSTLVLLRRKLTIDISFQLLRSITELLSTVYSDHLIDWLILILDSHCQQYLLSRNEQVFMYMKKLNDLIIDILNEMSSFQDCHKTLYGFLNSKSKALTFVNYSVEKIRLY